MTADHPKGSVTLILFLAWLAFSLIWGVAEPWVVSVLSLLVVYLVLSFVWQKRRSE
jgi:hypothetical protein